MFGPITFDTVSRFFKNSETILLARAQMFLAAIWSVAITFDFSALASGTVPTKQQYIMSGILFMQGMATEVARRRKTVEDAEGNLLPVEAPPKVGG